MQLRHDCLVGQSQLHDDVALLVIRREEAQDHHTLTLPAEPARLTQIRVALRRWLVGTGASQLATDDLVIAVGEAATPTASSTPMAQPVAPSRWSW